MDAYTIAYARGCNLGHAPSGFHRYPLRRLCPSGTRLARPACHCLRAVHGSRRLWPGGRWLNAVDWTRRRFSYPVQIWWCSFRQSHTARPAWVYLHPYVYVEFTHARLTFRPVQKRGRRLGPMQPKCCFSEHNALMQLQPGIFRQLELA